MTKEEIYKFLANTKVYVNGKSAEIQEKLFSLGYLCSNGSRIVNYANKPFLFIYDDKTICHLDDMVYFTNRSHREITAEEILSLEVTEPSYRPFNDAEECWHEMLKHEPFGWLKNKRIEYYTIILSVNDDRDYGKALSEYTFADGTPFGIKEE